MEGEKKTSVASIKLVLAELGLARQSRRRTVVINKAPSSKKWEGGRGARGLESYTASAADVASSTLGSVESGT